ncbi:hypothetical protein IGI39_003639 [Enterococcus sp. AZ135]
MKRALLISVVVWLIGNVAQIMRWEATLNKGKS